MTLVEPTGPSATKPDGEPVAQPKAKRARCTECMKAFHSSELLREHETVSGHRPPTCNVCKQTFTSWVSLREHEALGHDADGRPISSALPKLKLRDDPRPAEPQAPKSALPSNVSILGVMPRPTCFKCGSSYNSMAGLSMHQKRTRHKRHFFSCGCKRKFDTREEILNHLAASGHKLTISLSPPTEMLEDDSPPPPPSRVRAPKAAPKPKTAPQSKPAAAPRPKAAAATKNPYVAAESDSARPEPEPSHHVLVDTPEALRDAAVILGKAAALAVDLEAVCGPYGNHHGPLSLIQLATESGDAFLVDVLTLGTDVIKAHIGPLMESATIVKLMYDCRLDAETLAVQAGIVTRNAIDLQVYVAYQRLPFTQRPGRRVGLSRALWDYLQLQDTKGETVPLRMRRGESVWDERPLTPELREYAAADVLHLHALLICLYSRAPTALWSTVKLTERYLAMYTVGHLVDSKEPRSQVSGLWLRWSFNEPARPGTAIALLCDPEGTDAPAAGPAAVRRTVVPSTVVTLSVGKVMAGDSDQEDEEGEEEEAMGDEGDEEGSDAEDQFGDEEGDGSEDGEEDQDPPAPARRWFGSLRGLLFG